jgi:predicted lactoylglutathione lyase
MSAAKPPLANVLTLGVQDLQREQAFYRDLTWPLVFEDGDFVAFELQGVVLALFPVEKLAADSRARPEVGRGGIRFSMIITVDGPDEVDRLADRVRAAGGTFTKPPTDAEFFDGRDAYFSDPEGNYWEIAYAPGDNPVVAASRRAAGLD